MAEQFRSKAFDDVALRLPETDAPPKKKLTGFDAIAENFDSSANQRPWMAGTAKHEFTRAVESKVTPEQFAEDLQLSEQVGLSPELVGESRDELKTQKRISDFNADELIKTHPRTAEYLSYAENAKLSYDDIEAFKKLEGTINARKETSSTLGEMIHSGSVNALVGAVGLAEGVARVPRAAAETFDALSSVVASGMEAIGFPKSLTRKQEGGPDLNIFRYLERGVGSGSFRQAGVSDVADMLAELKAEDIPALFDKGGVLEEDARRLSEAEAALFKGDFGPLVDVVTDPALMTGLVAQAIPSLAVSMMTGGSLPALALLSGSEQMNNIADFEKKTGTKIDSTDYVNATLYTASLGAWLEKAGLNSILKPLGISKIADIGRAALGEGATELGQQITGNVAAKLTYNPEQTVTEGVLGSFLGGFGTGGLAGVPQAYSVQQDRQFRQAVKRKTERIKALGHQEEIDQVITFAQEAKTVKLSQKHSDEFLDLLDADAEVFIDKSVFDADIELPAFIEDQLQDPINSDVVLNYKQLSEIAQDETLLNHVRPHLRREIDGLSQEDLARTSQPSDVAEQVFEEAKGDDSAIEKDIKNIERVLLQQLKGTGRLPPDVARMSAKIIPQYVRSKVDTLGAKALDVFHSVGLRVEGDEAPKVSAPVTKPPIPLNQDFKGLVIEESMTIAETGKKGTLRQNVQKTWDRTVKKRNTIEGLVKCLNP